MSLQEIFQRVQSWLAELWSYPIPWETLPLGGHNRCCHGCLYSLGYIYDVFWQEGRSSYGYGNKEGF
jgi:hypothetical protein